MDNPLYSMLFAENLMEYVLNEFGINWVQEKNGIRHLRQHIDKHLFTSDVGDSVYYLILHYKDIIGENYNKLMAKGVNEYKSYRNECAVTLQCYISETPYDNVKFLKLCSSLVGLTQQYFQKNEPVLASEIALASSEILAFVINFFIFKQEFKPDDLWYQLRSTGKILVQKFKLGIPMPDTDEKILSSTFKAQTASEYSAAEGYSSEREKVDISE